jgi:uncharacterized membrane protein (UPF0127 family)
MVKAASKLLLGFGWLAGSLLPCVRAWSVEPVTQVCGDRNCFHVEVAATPEARENGLMFRDVLPEGNGMFFIFEDASRYSFWMKNMNFPIDILWIDDDKRIVDVKPDVPPCQAEPCALYTPKLNARYVLEIPAGAAWANGLKAGTKITF